MIHTISSYINEYTTRNLINKKAVYKALNIPSDSEPYKKIFTDIYMEFQIDCMFVIHLSMQDYIKNTNLTPFEYAEKMKECAKNSVNTTYAMWSERISIIELICIKLKTNSICEKVCEYALYASEDL